MMKQITLIFSCFFIISSTLFGQVDETINFQMILRDNAGELLTNSAIGLRFRIMQDTESGTVVFEETHSATTNSLGLVTVKIGSNSLNIKTIDWTTGLYFISTEIDPTGSTNYTLQQTRLLNSVPFAATTSQSKTAKTLDYNTLTNKPLTITDEQGSKIDFIDLTNAIDLDVTKSAVDLNTLKSFPGFGTTVGTAFEILWSKVADDAFFNAGTVGVGINSNLDTSVASLIVEGGALFPVNTGLTTEIGTLDYYELDTTTNGFYYTDNLGSIHLYNGNNDIYFNNEVNVLGNLAVGEGAVSSYNFNDNDLVLASATPSIFFQDTSNSGSFPSGDWRIRTNDWFDGGANYFSIDNVDSNVSNFKIMAEAPTNAFNILSNGNLGFQIADPTAALEVSNTVMASFFIGDASNLTNLPSGTTSTSNTGSTTIGADTNADTIGALIFETQNQTRMSIHNNGDVAIGANVASATLDVDGDAKMDRLTSNGLSLEGSLTKPITVEIPLVNQNIDILGKSVIMCNTTTESNTYFGFVNGTEGQVVTIINSGTGTLRFVYGGAFITINQNESITTVQNNGTFIVTSVVN